MIDKPFSQACENNKRPILNILAEHFAKTHHVLEIGSGTGQHAVFFGQHLPHLTWQTSDLAINHAGINTWLNEHLIPTVKKPIELDLNNTWSLPRSNLHIDGIFTANTLHIISWPLVVKFFESISKNINSPARVCIYGPFKYEGEFTSESNANFDLWLKSRDVNSGIRDIEAVLALSSSAKLSLINDYEMPANNRLLVFKKD